MGKPANKGLDFTLLLASMRQFFQWFCRFRLDSPAVCGPTITHLWNIRKFKNTMIFLCYHSSKNFKIKWTGLLFATFKIGKLLTEFYLLFQRLFLRKNKEGKDKAVLDAKLTVIRSHLRFFKKFQGPTENIRV